MKLDIIYNEDCLEGMKKLPDESIDLVFTDPPYGKEYLYLYQAVGENARRVLKSGRFLFIYASDYHFDKCFNYILSSLDFFYLFHIKMTSGCCARLFPKKIQQSCKTLMAFTNGKPKGNCWAFNFIDSPREKNLHPLNWQQSIADITYILDYYTDKDDIVLDPFMGSGTTAVGCINTNRHYIGFEINPEYCEIARKRLAEVQLELI